MRHRLAWLLATLCIGPAAVPQGSGTIKGLVIDEDGKPSANAEVHIAEKKAFVGHRVLKFYQTNDEGRFVIDNLDWGTYLVMVGKEGAGYPDTKLAFYSNLAVPTVTLAPAFPVANVTLKLPPKAGVLEIDSVSDALTHKEVDTASITLIRSGTPFEISTSASAKQRILVPALTDVSVRVVADGYESWPSKGIPESAGRIRLRPGEVFKFRIELQPVAGKAN